ncbi:MAG: flagellar FlbD family protein [Actinomycetes bacterium]
MVHRLKGEPFFLNADLIESIEGTPDTVITLVDSRRLVVADTPEEIVERIRLYRGSLLASADMILTGHAPQLTVLRGGEEE